MLFSKYKIMRLPYYRIIRSAEKLEGQKYGIIANSSVTETHTQDNYHA